jgi:hypothetical protein
LRCWAPGKEESSSRGVVVVSRTGPTPSAQPRHTLMRVDHPHSVRLFASCPTIYAFRPAQGLISMVRGLGTGTVRLLDTTSTSLVGAEWFFNPVGGHCQYCTGAANWCYLTANVILTPLRYAFHLAVELSQSLLVLCTCEVAPPPYRKCHFMTTLRCTFHQQSSFRNHCWCCVLVRWTTPTH